MPLETSPEALAERLYVLTLNLSEAADRADVAELSAIFEQRERIIGQLSSMDLPLSVLPKLDRIQEAERRALTRLFELKSLTAKEIGRGVKSSQVANAYRIPAAAAVFESFR